MDARTTCWTMIEQAAQGVDADRCALVDRYVGVVRAYIAARWRGTPLVQDIDDAVQEVFVELFRAGGALEGVQRRAGGFRAFLYGVVRNVARRFEQRRGRRREGHAPTELFERDGPDNGSERLTRLFDRAWAREVMREAADRQRDRARALGPAAERRVELLRLRFHEGLPIRDIARLWGAEAEQVHREYAKARREFRAVLEETVAAYHDGAPEEVHGECALLLAALA